MYLQMNRKVFSRFLFVIVQSGDEISNFNMLHSIFGFAQNFFALFRFDTFFKNFNERKRRIGQAAQFPRFSFVF